jgi:thioredoxin-like negative regulator of GroEL
MTLTPTTSCFWLLFEKNAFRAIAAEDATWLSNNRSDWFALDEIVGFSEAFLHDPEYGIAQLRRQLSAVARKDDPEDFDNSSDRLAGKLQDRGRSQEALPLLKELVQRNPNEAGFWTDYGMVLSDLGQHAAAIKALNRAIELNPSMEVSHECLAEALIRTGDLSGAESEYRAALSIYDAQYKKGEPTDEWHSLIKSAVKREAEHHWETALYEMRMKLAHILLLDKKYDDALLQAKAALDADRYQLAPFYLQAQIYDAKGDHAQGSAVRNQAAALLSEALASQPSWGKEVRDVDLRAFILTAPYGIRNWAFPHFPQRLC